MIAECCSMLPHPISKIISWINSKEIAIPDRKELELNLKTHCIPDGFENMGIDDYERFSGERRKLMAQKIKVYFQKL